MPSEVGLLGQVRGAVRQLLGAGYQFLQQSDGGELVVVQGLPPEAELARLGFGFHVVGTTVAPVAAVPTTAAHLSIYNGETGPNAASLIIAAVGSICTTTMAVAGQASVLARNSLVGKNADPKGALVIFGNSGLQFGGAVNAKASVTLDASDTSVWVPAGKSEETPATTTIGLNPHCEVYGRFIVRPGGMFSLATLAQTAVGSFQPYLFGYRLPLTLGG